MTKYVVSSTLQTPTWNNTTVLRGEVVEEASRLRQKLDGDILVQGSARLVQTQPLRLEDSKTVGDGIAILTYRPVGADAKDSNST